MDMLRDYLQKALGCGLLLRLYKELSVFLKEDPSEVIFVFLTCYCPILTGEEEYDA